MATSKRQKRVGLRSAKGAAAGATRTAVMNKIGSKKQSVLKGVLKGALRGGAIGLVGQAALEGQSAYYKNKANKIKTGGSINTPSTIAKRTRDSKNRKIR
jgi:hypothetical protein